MAYYRFDSLTSTGFVPDDSPHRHYGRLVSGAYVQGVRGPLVMSLPLVVAEPPTAAVMGLLP